MVIFAENSHFQRLYILSNKKGFQLRFFKEKTQIFSSFADKKIFNKGGKERERERLTSTGGLNGVAAVINFFGICSKEIREKDFTTCSLQFPPKKIVLTMDGLVQKMKLIFISE